MLPGSRRQNVKSPLTRSSNRKSGSTPRSDLYTNISNRNRSHYSGGQRQSLTQKQGGVTDKGKRGAKPAEKGGKDKKQTEKEIGSRPSSQVCLLLNVCNRNSRNVLKLVRPWRG